jgi:hypothetical protein
MQGPVVLKKKESRLDVKCGGSTGDHPIFFLSHGLVAVRDLTSLNQITFVLISLCQLTAASSRRQRILSGKFTTMERPSQYLSSHRWFTLVKMNML